MSLSNELKYVAKEMKTINLLPECQDKNLKILACSNLMELLSEKISLQERALELYKGFHQSVAESVKPYKPVYEDEFVTIQ